jgi:hypothetical protein
MSTDNFLDQLNPLGPGMPEESGPGTFLERSLVAA